MPFPANTRALKTAGHIAGVAGTAWLVWTYSIGPKLAWMPLATIVTSALFYVLLAWAISIVITIFTYVIAAPEMLGWRVFRASVPAVWFAPAVILLSSFAPAGLFAGVALVVNTSRVLISQWSPGAAAIRPVRWNPIPAFAAAFALEGGGVALLWRYPLLAASLLALSCAMLTALVVIRGGSPRARVQPLASSYFSVALTLLLAAALSTASLRFREFALNGDSGESDRSRARGHAVTDLTGPEPEMSAYGSGGFPGVILKVAANSDSVLVAPLRIDASKSSRFRDPIKIPFTGEYWMYQPPMIRPPRTSVVRRGSPLELSFHTTNGTSMSMEARQKLARPISLDCCAALELEIARQEGGEPVRLAVALIDSASRKSEDLGQAMVGSEYSQTVRYGIANARSITVFDEIRIVYRRIGARMDRSVHLAIQNFVLVPRSR